MPRILVTPPAFKNKPGPYKQVLEAAGCEVVYPPTDAPQMSRTELATQFAGIDAVLAGVELYDALMLELIHPRAIARVGVGYDSVDVAVATARGIPVCITPGTNEHSVAEHTLALIFACFREIACRDHEIRTGKWRRNPVRRLAGNTLGLIGLGRIGRAIVPRARALGLEILAYDPFPDEVFARANNIVLCSFDELLRRSDIVSLHLPCTAETTDLINAASIGLMKPGAVLINTARGGLVDEQALAEALTSKKLSAAGLDVLKVEPPSADHPLLKFPNVVLAPHMGGIDQTALDAMGALAAECVVKLSRGQWPAGCVVNNELEAAYKW
jgi:phosphoglycerate dehydrogenase-like enzyme